MGGDNRAVDYLWTWWDICISLQATATFSTASVGDEGIDCTPTKLFYFGALLVPDCSWDRPVDQWLLTVFVQLSDHSAVVFERL